MHKKSLLGLILSSAATFGQAGVVYVDLAGAAPRPADAAPAAPPFLDRQLAKAVIETLRDRRMTVVELGTSDQLGVIRSGDLLISMFYGFTDPTITSPAKYTGFSTYISQKNPEFEKSLSCSYEVAKALARAGERAAALKLPPQRNLIDPTGIREFDSLTVPKSVKSAVLLLEAGVLTDFQERLRLSQPATVKMMAAAIADGVEKCVH